MTFQVFPRLSLGKTQKFGKITFLSNYKSLQSVELLIYYGYTIHLDWKIVRPRTLSHKIMSKQTHILFFRIFKNWKIGRGFDHYNVRTPLSLTNIFLTVSRRWQWRQPLLHCVFFFIFIIIIPIVVGLWTIVPTVV